MRNPFVYGKPVTGEFFFPLPQLTAELSDFTDSKISLVIMGARRFGKTSFLRNFLADKRREGFIAIDVDAFNVVTHRDFLTQLLLAISRESSLGNKFMDWVRGLGNLRPLVQASADPTSGAFSLGFTLHKLSDEDVKGSILAVLERVPTLSSKPIILSIDEFQRIGELEDDGWLEATLRSSLQNSPDVTYIFTGSRRSLLDDMFNNPARPFYRSCKLISFPLFGAAFSEWIVERFRKAKVECPIQSIQYLRQKVDDSPHYVQEVCFHLVSQGVESVTPQDIDAVLDIISAQSSYSYEALMNTLTKAQIKVLRMRVLEGHIEYSRTVLDRYEIRTSSNVQAALRSLTEKQILEIDPATKKTKFDDPMFEIWLGKKLKQ